MDAPRVNRSLWLEQADVRYPRLEGVVEVDVAVIGAGITGVTTAYMLKAEGKTVALLESLAVSHGATGYTTAKLTVGHNAVYADLTDSFGLETARAYARSNQLAIERVAGLVEERGLDCDFERAANYVYAESADATGEIEREARAAREAGVDAELTTETDLPYDVAIALRVDGQGQFHPWKYVAGLAELVPGDGSHVFELSRATDVRSGDPCVVETESGSVRAHHVVVATQLPFLDRGLFFAKAHPSLSYVIGAVVDGERAPREMYISIDQPTRSVRSTPFNGQRVLLVGGEGHKPGAEPNTEERYRRLERFLQERFGIDEPEYRWSTHDYTPADRLPYIGRLSAGDERVLVATGYAKWGMTKSTVAAEILRDLVLGRSNEFAALYDSTRLDLRRSAPKLASENAKVGARFFADRLRRRPGRDALAELAPGDGNIFRLERRQYAVYRDDDGALHALSARCTHLGCIVGWNRADRTWECPCHGSRFAQDGTVVQGPATADLEPRDLPTKTD